MQALTTDQSQYIFDRLKHRFVDFITRVGDYIMIAMLLTPTQQLEFYEQVKHKLPELI